MSTFQYPPLAEPFTEGPFVPAWQPQSVDQVPRAARITAAVLATAIATFVVAPSALEAAARTTYPDQIHRPTVHASRQQALAAPVAPLDEATPRTWAPAYPDRVPPRLGLLAALQLAFTGPVEPPAAAPVAPDLAVASYPDWLPRPDPRETWLVSALVGEQLTADIRSGGPADDGVVRRAALIQYTALVGPVLVPVEVPPLSWGPVAPALHLVRRSLPTAQQQAVAASPEPVFGPTLAWHPVAPDQHLRLRALPAALQQAFAFAPEPIPDVVLGVVPLSWAPKYPDALRRRIWEHLSFVNTEPLIVAQTFDDLRWRGVYPDRLHRPWLLAAQQQAWAGPIEPVPAVVVPELAWASVYPDRVVRPTIAAALHQFYAANIDPIAEAAFVHLSWQPEYPDGPSFRVALLQHLTQVVTDLPLDPVTPLPVGWLAVAPDRIWGRPVPLALLLPASVWPGDPTTIAAGYGFVVFREIDVTQPGFGASVTQPSLSLEASIELGYPGLEGFGGPGQEI